MSAERLIAGGPLYYRLSPDSDVGGEVYERMLLERYTASYPRRPSGKVLFPFRRLFFIAYR